MAKHLLSDLNEKLRKEWIEAEYYIKGRKLNDVAKEAGVSSRTMNFYIRKWNILTHDYINKQSEKLYKNKKLLEQAYKTRTVVDIAKDCGCRVQTINYYMRKFNLVQDKQSPNADTKLTYDQLYDCYIRQELGTKTIAKMFGIGSQNSINKLLHKWNIPIREKSEAIRIASKKLSNRIKMSSYGQGISIDDWNGFTQTKEIQERKKSLCKTWRNAVFKRDNYVCQSCGHRGGKLEAHHIYNWSRHEDLRFVVNNGITLCQQCHSTSFKNSFHDIFGTRNNNDNQLQEYINNKSFYNGVSDWNSFDNKSEA